MGDNFFDDVTYARNDNDAIFIASIAQKTRDDEDRRCVEHSDMFEN